MPPLGIFRGLGSSRHGNLASLDTSTAKKDTSTVFRGLGSSMHSGNSENRLPASSESDLRKRLVEVTDSQTKMEVEYLNIITSLNKEKQEANDEIQKHVKQSSNLTETNQSLLSKVSDLEMKVTELETAKNNLEQTAHSIPESRPTSSSSSRDPQYFTFDGASSSRRKQELEIIKERLKSHSESNEMLNTKVQRIRDRYAKRRLESDDLSETSSVKTIGSTRSCISMVASSPRQHMVEVKKMEMGYERQLKINKVLEKRIESAHKVQAETSQQLEDLKKESNVRLDSHRKEIEDLNIQLSQARSELEMARQAFAAGSEDTRNDAETTRHSPVSSVMKNLQEEKEKVSGLNRQIKDKENQIESLKAKLDTFTETEKRLEELTIESIERLNAHNTEVDKLRRELEEVRRGQTPEIDADTEEIQNKLAEKSKKVTELEIIIHEKENEINEVKSELEHHKTLLQTIESQLAERNSEIENLRNELSKTKKRLEEVEDDRTKAVEDKSSDEIDRRDIMNKLEEERKKVTELQSRIKEKDDEIQAMQSGASIVDKPSEKSEEQLNIYVGEIAHLRSELSAAKSKLEAMENSKVVPDDGRGGDEKDEKSQDASEAILRQLKKKDEKISELESINEKTKSDMQRIKLEATSYTSLERELEKLNVEIKQARDDLTLKDSELCQAKEENINVSEKCKAMELDFVVTQEKNARTWQEMEDLKEKYEAEVERNSKLQNEISTIPSARHPVATESQDKSDLKNLENELKLKDARILELKSEGEKYKNAEANLETCKNDLAKVLDQLQKKEEEIALINNEKFQSSSRLETIELDMMIIQEKNAKTFEELENLREKYDFEIEEKTALQHKLGEISPEKILADAKDEHEISLRAKDGEIDELKKQLTDANVAKTEIELKLMDVMNDVLASQSTRDVMRDELESRLSVENEKAQVLQDMINGKEEDMERMRTEFEDLRIKMEKETDTKRNEISELNGEVVEKASKLSAREREFVQFQAEMDELKLKHAAEVASLRKRIDEAGMNEREMEMTRMQNTRLEEEITSLRTELNRLHMHGNVMSPDSSARILRTRNQQLKVEVDKLQTKLRRMRRNVTRIEL